MNNKNKKEKEKIEKENEVRIIERIEKGNFFS